MNQNSQYGSWSRMGLLTGALSLSYVLLVGLLQDTAMYRDCVWYFRGGLLLTGIILWIRGYKAQAQARSIDSENSEAKARRGLVDRVLGGGWHLAGVWLMSLAIISLVLVPPRCQGPVTARVVAGKAAESKAPLPTHDWPPQPLHIQGITLGTGKPSIIVDGRTYCIGDILFGAQVVSISSKQLLVHYRGIPRVVDLTQL